MLAQFARSTDDSAVMRFFFDFADPADAVGALDSLRATVARHGALRLRLRDTGSGLAQTVVEDEVVGHLGNVSASGGSVAVQESFVRRVALADGRRSWDLSCDPPVRTRLILFDSHAVLGVYVHRLACDGPSFRMLAAEFLADFQGVAAPAHCTATFSDYVEWETSTFAGLRRRNTEQIASELVPFQRHEKSSGPTPPSPAETCTAAFRAPSPRDGPVHLGCPASAWYLAAATAALWQVREQAGQVFAIRVNPRTDAFTGTVGALTVDTFCAITLDPDEQWAPFLRRVRDASLRSLAHAVFDYSMLRPLLNRLRQEPVGFNYTAEPARRSSDNGDGPVRLVDPFERIQREVVGITFGVRGAPWQETRLRLVWPKDLLAPCEIEEIVGVFTQACNRALADPDERIGTLVPAS